jgi:hypothetical protein
VSEFLAYRIFTGKLTIEKVPAKLRETVENALRMMQKTQDGAIQTED